ncbi:MAG: tetratricopeptide repeat protein [Myxococcales bacterium]|nr:tetratricopeptide repeat protein [Myxococcales bacterium]
MKLSAAARFALAARAPDEVLDLEELVIGIAAMGEPSIDYAAVSAQLDRLADEIRDDIRPSDPPDRVASQLAAAIGGRLGFHGDADVYATANSSFLDVVVAARRGLPILLGVVWILLGKRLGVPIVGVGFPGHFMVCLDQPGARIYIDPFHRGVVREARDLMARLPGRGTDAESARRVLDPTTERALLTRMLTNLKNFWIEADDHTRALAAIDRILLVGGEQAAEVRDRALVLLHLRRPTEAARDLRRYLKIAPGATDREVVEELLQRTEST